jgi:hypothetical protein
MEEGIRVRLWGIPGKSHEPRMPMAEKGRSNDYCKVKKKEKELDLGKKSWRRCNSFNPWYHRGSSPVCL